MAESVFEAVKQSVTVREAAQMYGIEVNRSGMACCPFHDDKNPSMKLNEEYFYCFGCGATGDVIDFTARLYNLSPKEAAEKLAQDFGLAYDSQAPPRRRYVRQKSEAQKFKEDRDHTFRVLADYFHLLRKWETDYTPKTPEENPHPRFMEAIQRKDYVGYLLDFFLEDTPDEQRLWIAEHHSEIANLERRVKFMADKPTNRERLQEITAGIEQGIKELFESEKYMRYLSVMSKFHRYSVNNTMLIYMQRPDATLVAGFNKWKNQFERHVKKGEHGITIIAPTPYKKKMDDALLSISWIDEAEWKEHRVPTISDLHGNYPQAENELMLPTWALSAMGISDPQVGMNIPVSYQLGTDYQYLSGEFVLSGYYTDYSTSRVGNRGSAYVSELFATQTGLSFDSVSTAMISFSDDSNVERSCEKLKSEIIFTEGQSFEIVPSVQSNSVSIILPLAAIIVFIIISGYLLIYNILYISISRDTLYRFYSGMAGNDEKQRRADHIFILRQFHQGKHCPVLQRQNAHLAGPGEAPQAYPGLLSI